MKKKVLSTIIVIFVLAAVPFVSLAHGGGTDANGGHRDNKNASGLGSYHYHHGYGPHLHPNGVCPYYTTSTISSTENPTTTKPVFQSLKKPSFPVIVNGTNLNITASQYYPVVINDITYVPLSSEVISTLNLTGGWENNSDGIVLNSTPSTQYVYSGNDEASFYHENACVIDDDSSYYHRYNCTLYNINGFYILNTEWAKADGYTPCKACYN